MVKLDERIIALTNLYGISHRNKGVEILFKAFPHTYDEHLGTDINVDTKRKETHKQWTN